MNIYVGNMPYSTTEDELRAIIQFLKDRVGADGEPVSISFESPNKADLLAAGLNPGGVDRLLSVGWWDEMVTDIIETPEMCDPDDSAAQRRPCEPAPEPMPLCN